MRLVNYSIKSSKNLTMAMIKIKNNKIDSNNSNWLINYLKLCCYFFKSFNNYLYLSS